MSHLSDGPSENPGRGHLRKSDSPRIFMIFVNESRERRLGEAMTPLVISLKIKRNRQIQHATRSKLAFVWAKIGAATVVELLKEPSMRGTQCHCNPPDQTGFNSLQGFNCLIAKDFGHHWSLATDTRRIRTPEEGIL